MQQRANEDPATGQDTAANQRRDPRVPMEEEVTITFATDALVGPGQNVSAQGLYFTTTATLRVQVKVAGSDRTLAGELVRVESMGNGRIGVAVRFCDPVGG